MNKNRGVTSLEIVISLALIVLFLALIFPILRLTLKMERSFIIRERVERNSARLIEMLEREIADSSFGNEIYEGKENLIDGEGVYQLVGIRPTILDKKFFSNMKERGNALFLEIPYVKKEKIYSRYYFYRFNGNMFMISQCSNQGGRIFFESEDIVFENIDGYFEQDKNGIKIVINIKKNINYIKGLKGYALKGRKM